MQKLYSELVGISVFDEYSRSPIAIVRDLIIDPETGKLLAFVVKNQHIIVPLDVIKVGRGLFVSDRSHILPMNDVLRVHEVAKSGIRIIGARVVANRTKKFLGKVVDFEVDTTHMALASIHVARTLLLFRLEERIFSYRSIIRITKNHILVEDIREVPVKQKVKARARSSAFA